MRGVESREGSRGVRSSMTDLDVRSHRDHFRKEGFQNGSQVSDLEIHQGAGGGTRRERS